MIINLFLIPFIYFCEAKRYDNYTLFNVVPVDDKQLNFIRNMSAVFDVNYWRIPGSLRMPVDFVVGPRDKESLLKEAHKTGVKLTSIIENIQGAFDNQTVKFYRRKQIETFGWKNYYRIKDIYNWLKDLAKAYPSEVKILDIGKTKNKRDIKAVKVVLKGSLNRSKVIIEGGIHAREWISPAFVTYMVDQIVNSRRSTDKNLRQLAVTYEWFFVPVLNPDGYEFTFGRDRLWRKNRNGNGVDLNRNFNFGFGSQSSSFNKLSDVYCGEKPFSEKETMAMSKFVTSNRANLEYYIAFHSFGQHIIIPSIRTLNFPEVKEMGVNTANKIKSYHNIKYSVGADFDTIGYKVSGDSSGWVKNTFNTPYVITFELRDKGQFGFALPSEQIIPTCEETLGGLLEFLKPKNKTFQKMIRDHQNYADQHTAGGTKACLDETVLMSYVLFSILLFY